jgi:methionine synthase I (cobalamin-dependent)
MLDRPLARIRDALPDAALVAMPSASAPGARGLSPNDFGAAAAHIAIAHRVSLVGGCCGASPAHVAALSAALAKAAC